MRQIEHAALLQSPFCAQLSLLSISPPSGFESLAKARGPVTEAGRSETRLEVLLLEKVGIDTVLVLADVFALADFDADLDFNLRPDCGILVKRA